MKEIRFIPFREYERPKHLLEEKPGPGAIRVDEKLLKGEDYGRSDGLGSSTNTKKKSTSKDEGEKKSDALQAYKDLLGIEDADDGQPEGPTREEKLEKEYYDFAEEHKNFMNDQPFYIKRCMFMAEDLEKEEALRKERVEIAKAKKEKEEKKKEEERKEAERRRISSLLIAAEEHVPPPPIKKKKKKKPVELPPMAPAAAAPLILPRVSSVVEESEDEDELGYDMEYGEAIDIAAEAARPTRFGY